VDLYWDFFSFFFASLQMMHFAHELQHSASPEPARSRGSKQRRATAHASLSPGMAARAVKEAALAKRKAAGKGGSGDLRTQRGHSDDVLVRSPLFNAALRDSGVVPAPVGDLEHGAALPDDDLDSVPSDQDDAEYPEPEAATAQPTGLDGADQNSVLPRGGQDVEHAEDAEDDGRYSPPLNDVYIALGT